MLFRKPKQAPCPSAPGPPKVTIEWDLVFLIEMDSIMTSFSRSTWVEEMKYMYLSLGVEKKKSSLLV